MTSNCFNTHCNTLSSKLNPDAPPFIPNPNPIHNKNDTASIGSTRGKSRRHGQYHNGQTNVTDIRLKTSDSNDRGSRNNVNLGHLNINRILHKIHHIREIVSQKHLSILAITETWLTQDISDGAVAVEGYRLFRRDRKTGQQGGGVCLYVHHQFPISTTLIWKYFGWKLLSENRRWPLVVSTGLQVHQLNSGQHWKTSPRKSRVAA